MADTEREDQTNFRDHCMNVIYDLMTIVISIADVVTDIVVLVSFYNADRMTFFTISLVILLLAQCAYAIAFIVRYRIVQTCGEFQVIALFFCLLPFGTLVAFIIYLTEDQESNFTTAFKKITGLTTSNVPHITDNDSKLTQFTLRKLSQHGGFVIEAGCEAFPQSLLQICAIVYYKEANYVSIASILISMLSVMSKALVFSKGIEIKTFLWTWMAIITDFYAIFFTLSWVFYSNENLTGDFYGYFTVIGEAWIYKDSLDGTACGYKVYYTFFWTTCGTFGACMMSGVAFIALEIFCFAFIALAIYFIFTNRFDTRTKHQSIAINTMLDYIAHGTGNRKIRILALNRALDTDAYPSPQIFDVKQANALNRYVHEIQTTHGPNALDITYGDMRRHSDDPQIAQFCGNVTREFMAFRPSWDTVKISLRDGAFSELTRFILWHLLLLFTPIVLIAKIFQIVFPYFILLYLYMEGIALDQIDMFQRVMLFSYIGMQCVLLLLGISVFRINYWLFHIRPGAKEVHFSGYGSDFMQRAREWQEEIEWYPVIEKMIKNKFTDDIGLIIMQYFCDICLD